MRLTSFLISVVFLLFDFLGGEFIPVLENSLAIFLIGFLGMAHGSIDHVLGIKILKIVPKNKALQFIVGYISIILLYGLLWLVFPVSCFVFFLIYSSYHFGQSDTLDIAKNINRKWQMIIGFNYGTLIISTLTISNVHFLNTILPNWFTVYLSVEQLVYFSKLTLVSSLAIFLVSLVFLFIHKKSSSRNLILILLQTLFVLILFYKLPPIVSFSLYFGLWHSLVILEKEYLLLKETKVIKGIFDFVYLLTPFTLTSLIGLIILVYILDLNSYFTLLIFISAIAFPHTLIMDKLLTVKQHSN